MTTPDSPSVSIIMNCFNGEMYLREALDSVFHQTHENWEMIFWDNQSIDGSARILKEYNDDRIRYFLAEKHTNLGEARKNAMIYAKGEYISFLDCDDVYNNNKLEKQIELMEQYDYAMCYAGLIGINQNGKRKWRHTVKPRHKSGFIFCELLIKYEVNMQTVMLRTSILKENSYQFDTNLVYSPDYHLFMTIASENKVGVIPIILAKQRIHNKSLSCQTRHLVANEGRYTLDHLKKYNIQLYKSNEKSFKYAYDNLAYYNAVNILITNDSRSSIEFINTLKTNHYKIKLLKTLISLNLPKFFILYLIKRH